MSKQSKSLKNSKAGKKQAAAKSLKKSADKEREKHLEEASRPAPLSLKKDNRGKPLTDLAQLLIGGFGIFCFIFVISYIVTFVLDFLASGEDYTLAEYFNTCEPALACRVADVSELLVVIFLVIVGIFSLKIAFTNRHAGRRTLRFMLGLVILSVIFYLLEFVLNHVFWQ